MNPEHSSLKPVLNFIAQRGVAAVAHGDGSGAHYVGQHVPPVRSALEAAVRLFADSRRFTEVRVFCGKSLGDGLPSWRLPGAGGERIVGTEPMAFSLFGASEDDAKPAPDSFAADFLGEQNEAVTAGCRPSDVDLLGALHVRVTYLLEEFARARPDSLLIVDESYFQYAGQFPDKPNFSQGDDLAADRPPTQKLAITDGEKLRAIPRRCAEKGANVLLVFRTLGGADAFIAGDIFKRRVPQMGKEEFVEERPAGFYDFRWAEEIIIPLPSQPELTDLQPSRLSKSSLGVPLLNLVRQSRLTLRADPMRRLKEMTGMEAVAARLERWRRALRVAKSPLKHIRLVGNPGTGKSTVSEVIGESLREMGYLRLGHFVKASASSDILGQHVGATATNLANLLRSAVGGVLFLDEIYMLEESKFCDEVIGPLLEWTDGSKEILVILGGYEERIETFLKKNKGLGDRFREIINLPDYEESALWMIVQKHIKKAVQALPHAGAEAAFLKLIELRKRFALRGGDEFANVRTAIGFADDAIENLSSRHPESSIDSMRDSGQLVVEAEDFNTVIDRFRQTAKRKGITID